MLVEWIFLEERLGWADKMRGPSTSLIRLASGSLRTPVGMTLSWELA
jgi:hypothetical protein